jgi:hypothetical protein
VQKAYYGAFGMIAACMVISAVSPKLVARVGAVTGGAPIEPMREISPATLGGVA